MPNELNNYSRLERSAIHEMANIGLGHAMTSLSDLTGRSFNMSVPKVEAVAMDIVPNMIGGDNQITVGIYMAMDGDVRGHMAFLFPWSSAQELWRMLLGTAPEDISEVDELASSAMLEIGNIINSSFLDAISELTGLKVHATPPLVSMDTSRSIVSSIIAEAELGDSIALAIETHIFETKTGSTEGYFLCIPERDSIELFFDRLKVRKAA